MKPKKKIWILRKNYYGVENWKTILKGKIPHGFSSSSFFVFIFFLNENLFSNPIRPIKIYMKYILGKIKKENFMFYYYGPKILKDIYTVCNKINFKPFLVFGTLLGLVRENDFIECDDDVDFGIMEDVFDNFRETIKEELLSRQYELRFEDEFVISFVIPHYSWLHIDFFKFYHHDDKIKYSLFRDNKKWTFSFSSDIFLEFEETMFMRTKVYIPQKKEKFLNESYGNWKSVEKNFDFVNSHPNLEK